MVDGLTYFAWSERAALQAKQRGQGSAFGRKTTWSMSMIDFELPKQRQPR